MKSTAGLWVMVMTAVGSAACTPSGECQRTSDCESGRTCVARKCQAAATDAGPLFSSSGGSGGSGGSAQCFTLSPSAVVMHGTLSEGACYRDALGTLAAPGNPCVGFACSTDPGAVRQDGRYVYSATDDGVVRVFTPDTFVFLNNSWEYPMDPGGNDEVLPTPGCPANPGVSNIMLYPDTGGLLYRCFNNPEWYDAAGLISSLNGKELLWTGNGGRLLVRNSNAIEIMLRSGTVTPVTGLPATTTWVAYRSTGNGFYLASLNGSTGTGDRWLIQEDGTAVLSTSWTGMPANITARPYSCVMGGAGDLYCEGSDTSSVPDDVVVLFPASGGMATVPYTETGLQQDWSNRARRPDVKLHISKLVTGF